MEFFEAIKAFFEVTFKDIALFFGYLIVMIGPFFEGLWQELTGSW